MKKAIFTLAIAILALSTTSFAQRTYYAATNDDNPSGNTATIWGFNGGTQTLSVTQTLHTGGTGSGGGYFANSRINLLGNSSCLFISDAGSADIAGFPLVSASPLTFGTTPTITPSGGPLGSALGTGLISTPDGKLLIASLGENFELAVFTISSGCHLTSVKTISFNDEAGPMAITSDGKVLVVPEPNNQVLDAYTVTESSPYLTALGSPLNLGSVSSCSSSGCFPTGTDISVVSGGKATTVSGNATLSGPFYVTATLNESSGLSNAVNSQVTNTGNENVESPYYSSAAQKGNGWLYLGAAGFGGVSAGEPGGVSTQKVASGVISPAAANSFTNSAAVYCTNVQSTGVSRTTQANEYLWQGIVDENFNNDMYIYKVRGSNGVIKQVTSAPNPNAQGGITFVLTLASLPGTR